MIGIVACELHAVPAVNVHGEQLFLAGNHRNVDEPFAIRRWRRIEVLGVGDLERDSQWQIGAWSANWQKEKSNQ
jgi:hypothetical protein